MAFYQELYDCLTKLKGNEISFTLSKLNELINNKLPASAETHYQPFFSNGESNTIYNSSWRRAGFIAKYDPKTKKVTFYREGSEPKPAPSKEKREADKEYETLVIRNFSGSFNENGIGHEIINAFNANNNRKDFYIFYVPPYGSVASETIGFLNNPVYRGIKKILVFDSTTITNVLKLKSVILDPIPLDNETEMLAIANQFKYGPNDIPLARINFNDDEFQKGKKNKVRLFPFTYKVNKNKYFNLEDENIFIWHKRTEATNRLKLKSLRQFRIVFGGNSKMCVLSQTSMGEKNYAYTTIKEDFEDFFQKKIVPLLKKKKPWALKRVPKALNIPYRYNKDNFLEYVRKTTDENLYTNFICSVLNSNEDLKNRFFSWLVGEYLKKNSYVPSNLKVEAQYQSLIAPKKAVNNYIRAKAGSKNKEKLKRELINDWGFKESQISSLKLFIDGQMDIYLHDDNYRIAIENKILCGINGKHEDIDEDVDQLKTYKTFLKDLNDLNLDGGVKENKVLLLTPKNVANNYVNYDKDVPVMSYLDLAEFFTSNKELIPEKYRNDFLNAIYKHAMTREEDVTSRFFETLQ